MVKLSCGPMHDRCYYSVYNCVCLRLKSRLPFSETSLFKDIGTIKTRITSIWKTHKDSHCVEVTACKILIHMDKRVRFVRFRAVSHLLYGNPNNHHLFVLH